VYTMVERAQGVIDFLNRAFDGIKLRRFDAPDGRIMHAEVPIGDTVVMIADAGGAYPRSPFGCMFMSPTRKPPTRKPWLLAVSPSRNPSTKKAIPTSVAA
jgi:uncharacterized glyoxalase superfamily protein PhnB